MDSASSLSLKTVPRDLAASLVVFLVALPLCLGIALASGAPAFAGVVAGIVGGIVVGSISRSQTSVSGPAAGLTAVVAAQILALGSFEAFLVAVVIAGALQLILGIIRAGFLAAFFPTSVIKGLLAAIGVLLILKEIPHLFGHDADYVGEMSFLQPDNETTFSELFKIAENVHLGAMVVGLLSVGLLLSWEKLKWLKKSGIPGPLVVVLFGVGMNALFKHYQASGALEAAWVIGDIHLVIVPVANSVSEFFGLLKKPAFTWEVATNPALYTAAFTIAIVASLESLLNLEAVDKIDPKQRHSPPSRELVAQGVGNMTSGLLGGLPITSVIVRSSVNINAGGQTKLSAIFHGILLLGCVMLVPHLLNTIPLSSLAAILIVTGFKLASPKLFIQMWRSSRYQFIPFVVTVLAIVFTDLLIGILIGLSVSISFILYSNFRRPLRRVIEKHLRGDVLRIDLPDQVSFFKRPALEEVLDRIPSGGQVLIDATNSDYIDPDVLDLISNYKQVKGPARGVDVSLVGFRDKYNLDDHIQFVDYSTRELQSIVSPAQVLEFLKAGNKRFRAGERLNRNYSKQVSATSIGQHPLAVILSCIDSRAPVEILFDLGVGDVFTTRVAGNITSRKVLGSMEYGCAVAGAKLIVVMGHTRCGAVTTAVQLCDSTEPMASQTGCQHVDFILNDIRESVDIAEWRKLRQKDVETQSAFVDNVAKKNVVRMVERIVAESDTIARLVEQQKVAIVGAMYDVASGEVTFCDPVTEPRGVVNLEAGVGASGGEGDLPRYASLTL